MNAERFCDRKSRRALCEMVDILGSRKPISTLVMHVRGACLIADRGTYCRPGSDYSGLIAFVDLRRAVDWSRAR